MNNLNFLNKKVYDFFNFLINPNYYKNFADKLLSDTDQISFKYCEQKNLVTYNVAIANFAIIVNNSYNKKARITCTSW